MIIKANAYELANDLAHWRIANEIRLPLEEVIQTDDSGETKYTERIEKLFLAYYEHYLTALKDYKDEL